MANKDNSALSNPVRYFQNTSVDGYCTYMETEKHYYYRSINGGTARRISSNDFTNALNEHYGY